MTGLTQAGNEQIVKAAVWRLIKLRSVIVTPDAACIQRSGSGQRNKQAWDGGDKNTWGLMTDTFEGLKRNISGLG